MEETILQLEQILRTWTSIPTIAACLIFGYIIKNYIDVVENKHIPLIMAIMGVLLTLLIQGEYVGFIETIMTGAFSGLASTGLHQFFYQYIKPDYKVRKLEGEVE